MSTVFDAVPSGVVTLFVPSKSRFRMSVFNWSSIVIVSVSFGTTSVAPVPSPVSVSLSARFRELKLS